MLNGDFVTGEKAFLENAMSYLDMIVDSTVAHGKTWASTYSNNGYQYNVLDQTNFAWEKAHQ